MEAELKENTVKLSKIKREAVNTSENLSKLQAKLKESGFKM
jgi:hypothetical protein